MISHGEEKLLHTVVHVRRLVVSHLSKSLEFTYFTADFLTDTQIRLNLFHSLEKYSLTYFDNFIIGSCFINNCSHLTDILSFIYLQRANCHSCQMPSQLTMK